MATNGGNNFDNEGILKGIVKDTVESICRNGNEAFKSICSFASRSALDRAKVVNLIFEMMTAPPSPLELDSALAQVNEALEWENEE